MPSHQYRIAVLMARAQCLIIIRSNTYLLGCTLHFTEVCSEIGSSVWGVYLKNLVYVKYRFKPLKLVCFSASILCTTVALIVVLALYRFMLFYLRYLMFRKLTHKCKLIVWKSFCTLPPYDNSISRLSVRYRFCSPHFSAV